jgi:hypothetical protein
MKMPHLVTITGATDNNEQVNGYVIDSAIRFTMPAVNARAGQRHVMTSGDKPQ